MTTSITPFTDELRRQFNALDSNTSSAMSSAAVSPRPGAAAAVGGGLGGLALRQSRELTETDGYQVRQELIEAGKTNAAIADGLLIAGGALAISGLVLVLTTLRPRPKAQTQALAPAVGPRHAGLVWQGRF